MSQVALKAEQRESLTKGSNKRLRKSGIIPAVVYGQGNAAASIQIAYSDLWAALHSDAGRNVLIDLEIKDAKSKKKQTVVIKELQQHPVHEQIIHVDFHEISLKDKILVNIPVHEKGESPGVKNEGGVLEFPLRELQIECLPTDIPEAIDVDISKLGLNQSIHVKDLIIASTIIVKNEPGMVVVQVKPPVELKVEEPTEEGATEPEVIGEKKEGEEGEEGTEGAEKPEEKKEEPKKNEEKK